MCSRKAWRKSANKGIYEAYRFPPDATRYQAFLPVGFLRADAVRLWNPAPEQVSIVEPRIVETMADYRDLPCDFADATLIAVAEIENIRRVFTFDRHFYS